VHFIRRATETKKKRKWMKKEKKIGPAPQKRKGDPEKKAGTYIEGGGGGGGKRKGQKPAVHQVEGKDKEPPVGNWGRTFPLKQKGGKDEKKEKKETRRFHSDVKT